MLKKILVLSVAVLLCLCSSVLANESVGSVKSVSGAAEIVRGEQVIPVTAGQSLFPGDLIRTKADGALGIILQDDTILSLGGESELRLSEFVFEPKDSRFSVVIKLLKGTFVYLSGVIGKLAPDSIRLETPTSSIAVRGTRLLVRVAG